MAVKKNALLVRFINVDHNPGGKDWLHYELPLKDKTYYFFITPKDRKKVDIGTIIKSKNLKDDWHLPDEAVVIGNVTVRNAKLKHRQVDKITEVPLRKYIHKRYHNSHFARLAEEQLNHIISSK